MITCRSFILWDTLKEATNAHAKLRNTKVSEKVAYRKRESLNHLAVTVLSSAWCIISKAPGG